MKPEELPPARTRDARPFQAKSGRKAAHPEGPQVRGANRPGASGVSGEERGESRPACGAARGSPRRPPAAGPPSGPPGAGRPWRMSRRGPRGGSPCCARATHKSVAGSSTGPSRPAPARTPPGVHARRQVPTLRTRGCIMRHAAPEGRKMDENGARRPARATRRMPAEDARAQGEARAALPRPHAPGAQGDPAPELPRAAGRALTEPADAGRGAAEARKEGAGSWSSDAASGAARRGDRSHLPARTEWSGGKTRAGFHQPRARLGPGSPGRAVTSPAHQ